MKLNHDDDLPAHLSDSELERNTEHATDSARASGETGADPQFEEPDSWARADERNNGELSAHFLSIGLRTAACKGSGIVAMLIARFNNVLQRTYLT